MFVGITFSVTVTNMAISIVFRWLSISSRDSSASETDWLACRYIYSRLLVFLWRDCHFNSKKSIMICSGEDTKKNAGNILPLYISSIVRENAFIIQTSDSKTLLPIDLSVPPYFYQYAIMSVCGQKTHPFNGETFTLTWEGIY